MTLFGTDLPRPSGEHAVVYLLGPGIGESIVVALPDDQYIVVDTCMQGSTNLPLALLEHLGAKRLALLVVTHPDLDHIRGIADLLRKLPPDELWRYPLEASVRDVVADWARRGKRHALREDLAAIADYVERTEGDASTAAYGNVEWPPGNPVNYRLRALAPTEYDKARASRVLNQLLIRSRSRLDSWLKQGSGGAPGDAPNVLSVAVLLEIGAQRVLFGGDVLRGTGSPKSGWKGVLRLLKKHGRAHLFEDITAVKLPHHGAHGAFEPATWALHAKSSKPIAFGAPFSRSRLPDQPTLRELRALARPLLLSAPHAQPSSFASAEGWAPAQGSVLAATKAPLVGLSINVNTSTTSWFVSKSALAFG